MIDHVVIVVPARNEAHNIARSLRSIQRARGRLDPTITSSLVVVGDSCTDHTLTAALALVDPTTDRVLSCSEGAAGAARLLGTASGLNGSSIALDRVWLAHTDADTTVPDHWLVQQLDHAERGAIGVAGIVHLDLALLDDHTLADAFCRSYAVNTDGTHGHVHGANLGCRADRYVSVGGWSPMATGEDHDLWNRLRRDGSVISDATLSVATDPRRRGRAPHGFSCDIDRIARSVA